MNNLLGTAIKFPYWNRNQISLPMTLDQILANFWSTYIELNPSAVDVKRILSGSDPLINDHVAFRTLNMDPFKICQIAGPFLARGYQAKGEYVFTNKKLLAHHFEHPNQIYPKLFISQLQVDLCSSFLQSTMQSLVELQPTIAIDGRFLTAGRWWPIEKSTYDRLLAESEYAAWFYVFGFVSNHFTILVNCLTEITDLVTVNQRLKKHGFKMNTNGGEIKGSSFAGLEYSSTLAHPIPVQFSDHNEPILIPACYYEFAKRHNGFSGFIVESADKIFESTNSSNTQVFILKTIT